MGTTAQRFHLTTTDQDQAWGTDVRKLDDTAGTTTSTTITTHPSSAGTTTNTVDPFTSVSATTDNRTTLGWAIDEAAADGMQSVATGKRIIPAGTWTFFNRVTYAAGGLVTGGHFITLEYNVYRVATGGGSRTLLFTASSAEQAGTNGGATASITTNVTSRPQYTMEAGETIHVAYRITDRQVAGTLGGTTAGNNVFITGAATDAYVDVPSPGIRTIFLPAAYTGGSTPSGAILNQTVKFFTSSIATSAGGIKKVILNLVSGETPGAGVVFKQPRRSFTGTITSSAAILKRPTRILSSTVTPGPSAIVRLISILRTSNITPGIGVKITKITLHFTSGETPGAGQVFKRYMPIPKTGTITPGPGSLIRRPGKLLSSVITPGPSAISALLRKNVQGTITPSGSVRKGLFRFFTGSVASASTAVKRANRYFNGLIGPTVDWPVTASTRQVAGVVKDQNGDIVVGATVKLFRVADDAFIGSTTSAGDGTYSFVRDQNDPFVYFVVAYEEVGVPTQGLTIRNLNPTVI